MMIEMHHMIKLLMAAFPRGNSAVDAYYRCDFKFKISKSAAEGA
jgi:hypothetical protein